MSESIQAQPTSNPKVLIITTLITAATTVAVSYVGMRRPSQPEVRPPTPSISSAFTIETPTPAPVVKEQTITGTILGKDRKGKRNVEVSLVPADGMMAKTIDGGHFMFSRLPPGTYKIIVQEAGKDAASAYLRADKNEAPLSDADMLIKYNIIKGDQ
jgi:hypothetical protein